MNKSNIRRHNNPCRWYDSTSGMKRAYDADMFDREWIDNYCMKGGQGCIRKKRFEEHGYVSPDYILPEGTVDKKLKTCLSGKW